MRGLVINKSTLCFSDRELGVGFVAGADTDE